MEVAGLLPRLSIRAFAVFLLLKIRISR
jgi:hypothetical protein